MGDRGSVIRTDLEAGRSQLGTIQKQADGLVLSKFAKVDQGTRIGDRQRGNSPDRFAADAERLTAGGKNRDAGTRAEDGVYKAGAIRDHVLAVVNHK